LINAHLLLDKNIGAVQISHIAAKLKLDKMVTYVVKQKLVNKIATGC